MFSCVVQQLSRQQCLQSHFRLNVTTQLTLSSDQLSQSGCATTSVRLRAREGQRLNISIVDFTTIDEAQQGVACTNYLQLSEDNQPPHTICASSPRIRHVMTSQLNEVVADFRLHDPPNQRFLLTFEGDLSFHSTMTSFRDLQTLTCDLCVSDRMRQHQPSFRCLGAT